MEPLLALIISTLVALRKRLRLNRLTELPVELYEKIIQFATRQPRLPFYLTQSYPQGTIFSARAALPTARDRQAARTTRRKVLVFNRALARLGSYNLPPSTIHGTANYSTILST